MSILPPSANGRLDEDAVAGARAELEAKEEKEEEEDETMNGNGEEEREEAEESVDEGGDEDMGGRGEEVDAGEEGEVKETEETVNKDLEETTAFVKATPLHASSHEVIVVTGGADSLLNIWRDTTELEQEEEIVAAEIELQRQQELFNAMALRDYKKVGAALSVRSCCCCKVPHFLLFPQAIRLCLVLKQPQRLRLILQELLEVGPIPKDLAKAWPEAMKREQVQLEEERSGLTEVMTTKTGLRREEARKGEETTREVLTALKDEHIETLCEYVKEWNTHASFCNVAQRVSRRTKLFWLHAHCLTVRSSPLVC